MKEYRYTAFISYRHLSPDKEIADRLQKMLENYQPPKSLRRQKSGKWRIFRDETELPTSRNLGDDIQSALESSEFLIVICSRATAESRWCMEEIRHFKEIHGGSNANIITLVVDGTPGEVFPEELCHERISVTDSAGHVTFREREIEPLAANVAADSLRAAFKKLKTEYLRIAAPLLGCGYDTLYNREHRKKIRRLITVGVTVLALMLAFTVYTGAMLWQINNQRIALAEANDGLQQKTEELQAANYSLRTQNAEILANQAEIYLENGDVYSAVEAALEALPQKGETIPESPLAKRILADGTGAYSSAQRMLNRKVTLAGYAEYLEFSEDGTRILARDSTGTVYVIDYERCRILTSFPPMATFGSTTAYIADIRVVGNMGYVLANDILLAVDLQSGAEKWRYSRQSLYPQEILVNGDAGMVGLRCAYSCLCLSTDGTLLYEVKPEGYNGFQDTVYLSLEGDLYILQQKNGRICAAGKERSVCQPFPIGENDEIFSVGENADGIFIHMGVSEEYAFPFVRAKVLCCGKEDLQLKWETEYTSENLYPSRCGTAFAFTHAYNTESGEAVKREGWLVSADRELLIFDCTDGELYFRIAALSEDEELVFCAPADPFYYLQMATTKYYASALMALNTFSSGREEYYFWLTGEEITFGFTPACLDVAAGSRVAAAHEDSSEILMPQTVSPDHTMFKDMPSYSRASFRLSADNGSGIFAGYIRSADPEHALVLYDVREDALILHRELAAEMKHMVFVEDALMYLDADGKAEVLRLTGETVCSFDLKEKLREAAGMEEPFDGYIFGLAAGEGQMLVVTGRGVFAIRFSGETVHAETLFLQEKTTLEGEYAVSGSRIAFVTHAYANTDGDFSKARRIALLGGGDTLCTYVQEDGRPAEFAGDAVFSLIFSETGDTLAFISKEGYIGLYRPGEDSIKKIPTGMDGSPMQLLFTPDGQSIIALCANGRVIRYSAETLEKLAERALDWEVSEHADFAFADPASLYLRTTASADKGIILELETLQPICTFDNFLHFMTAERKILFSKYENGQYRHGYYKYFTTEELMAFARDFLQNR